jgi:hypothetical protein
MDRRTSFHGAGASAICLASIVLKNLGAMYENIFFCPFQKLQRKMDRI